jgi:hypothetical protein
MKQLCKTVRRAMPRYVKLRCSLAGRQLLYA